MTAFRLAVSRGRPGGASIGDVDVAVDPDLARRGHVSLHRDGDLLVVCLGTLLGPAAMAAARAGATDAAIAGAAYRRHGLAWLAEACGDFALAVVDGAAGSVHLARNHAGTRPLFVRIDEHRVLAGSDYHSVGADPSTIDPAAVAAYLAARHSPDRVLPAGIGTVRPAHVTTIGPDGMHHRRYWDPAMVPTRRSMGITAAAAELRRTVGEVVGEWLERFPGPLGTHLTGGLDSAMVSHWAAAGRRALGGAAPVAFAWQPPTGDPASLTADQQLLADAAEHLGLHCETVPLTADAAAALLALDPVAAPITSTLLLEAPVVAAAASEGVELLLSGWGGDELASFNGRHRANRRAAAMRRAAIGWARGGGPSTRRRLPFGYLAPSLHELAPPPTDVSARTARGVQLAMLGSGHLYERTDSWSVHAAASGLQHAYPLLDRRVIELALGLPDACYPRGRAVMREALRGDVAESVRTNRSKEEPSRTEASDRAFEEFVRSFGADLPVVAERLGLLDAGRLAAALDAPGPIANAGKLTRAVQLLHDPAGTPLRRLAAATGVQVRP